MNASQPEPPATAFELAAIAAAVDPVLSKAKPPKAVELARQLLLAAQKHIDRPLREERRQDLEWEKLLRRFPDGERLPVSSAFERWGSDAGYKTERTFVAALRREKLTAEFLEEDAAGHLIDPFFKKGPPRFVEMTSKRAVDTLCRRKHERKKKADRERKARRQMKLHGKSPGNLRPRSVQRRTEKGKVQRKKRNSVS